MCFANVYWLDGVQNSVRKLAVISYAFMCKFLQSISSRGGFLCFGENMFQFLMCLFGLHGATEIGDDDVKECRDCLKEVK